MNNYDHLVGYKSRGLCKRFYFDEDNKVETLKICVGDRVGRLLNK